MRPASALPFCSVSVPEIARSSVLFPAPLAPSTASDPSGRHRHADSAQRAQRTPIADLEVLDLEHRITVPEISSPPQPLALGGAADGRRPTPIRQGTEPPNLHRRLVVGSANDRGRHGHARRATQAARGGDGEGRSPARYRTEIVDYAASDPEFIENDVLSVTRRCLSNVLDNIATNSASPSRSSSPSAGDLLARRPHQGVALPSIQHAFRLFGEEVFDALAACASPDRPEELQAVIRGGAVIMRFAHEVISVVTQTYLDELEDVSGDREIVSRSLLDAVLAGRGSSASSARDARILGIDLLPQNVVIVVRAPVGDDDSAAPRSSVRVRCGGPQDPRARTCCGTWMPAVRSWACARARSSACVPHPRRRMPSERPRPRTGRRRNSTNWECPSASDTGASRPRKSRPPIPRPARRPSSQCAPACATRPSSTTTCWSTTCCAPTRTPAASIAAALGPLREYDALRNASLVDTLRAYVEANFSISRRGPHDARPQQHGPLPPRPHPETHRPGSADAARHRLPRAQPAVGRRAGRRAPSALILQATAENIGGSVRNRVRLRGAHPRYGRSRGRLVALCCAFAAVLIAAGPAQAATGDVRIEVLSNRADLISGGDALVQIDAPAGRRSRAADVDGRDVTSAFASSGGGRMAGLVTGLRVGENTLTAKLADGGARAITITNHPIGGPGLRRPAGPAVGLQHPDRRRPTAAPARRSSRSGSGRRATPSATRRPAIELRLQERERRASSTPTTRTTRRPTSSDRHDDHRPGQDRAATSCARSSACRTAASTRSPMLAEPGAWNHKLLTYFGASTAPDHLQSQPSAVLDDMALSRGFMTANSSLNVHGQNTNENVSAEALMMLKEHIVETYGPIRYTIGQGCSGGSYQYMIAVDVPRAARRAPAQLQLHRPLDDGARRHRLRAARPLLRGQPAAAVGAGDRRPQGPERLRRLGRALLQHRRTRRRASNCKLPDDAGLRPGGHGRARVRCTMQDYQEAIWGPRPKSQWGPVEKQIGKGFANRPWGNAGVQYGLRALEAGEITPAEFVDLNAKIGGLDIDHKPQAERSAVDANTAAIAYRTGQVTDPRQLATRADHRPARLQRDRRDPHVVLQLQDARAPGQGQRRGTTTSSSGPSRRRRRSSAWRRRRTSRSSRSCSSTSGSRASRPTRAARRSRRRSCATSRPTHATRASRSPASPAIGQSTSGPTSEIEIPRSARQLYPHYGNTRTAAGGPMTDDIIQCRLKPLDPEATTASRSPTPSSRRCARRSPTASATTASPASASRPRSRGSTFADGPGGRPLGAPPQSVPLRRG